tara:strand:- start:26930 stop:27328 length:399 start_codon:yes stop_codon:yes gene_type:complete
MNYAPTFPLQRGDVNGYKMITRVRDLVKFHLKNLILTSPGEKISDVKYGIGMRRYLFEPLTQSTINKIRDNISIQIATYLKYLNVMGVGIVPNEDYNQITISIKYTIRNINVVDVLSVQVDGSSSNASSGFY